ncbi:MAG TPA: cobaltochelatase subunit CobN [Pyrinomonadaceae bacterium]|jgi:magnesium chelatase subunit H
MNVTVLYVGSSLLAPLKQAEREIERAHGWGLRVAAYNFGAALAEDAWREVGRDLAAADIVFVIHVTDGENAARLLPLLAEHEARHRAVVVFNCMPELMRRTRMGRLRFGGAQAAGAAEQGDAGRDEQSASKTRRLVGRVGAWMGEQARARRGAGGHAQYLRYVERLPALLRFVPSAGRLGDLKHYLYLFCYFLQPTPANVRAMLLYALKHYAADAPPIKRARIELPPPETLPAVGLYHPEAPALFASYAAYRKWYDRRARARGTATLAPERTVGLLLLRPQIVSGARAAYDGLIRAVESEGLAVLPAISTFMDNRAACAQFFTEGADNGDAGKGTKTHADVDGGHDDDARATQDAARASRVGSARVSQIVSLTGFSFVGGPAMNDSAAAVEFLRGLNRPFRSAVSLDVQTVEAWRASGTGLNPVQAGMQVAIPELDGATEPFVYGGMPAGGDAPVALEERCRRVARRLRRWQRLQTSPRRDLRLALVTFCFPPNKGNVGTAADLDVFPSLHATLARLRAEGYACELPAGADELRERLLGGNSERFAATANVAYRMDADEYRRLCPYVAEIEAEWGRAPGRLNTFGGALLIQGLQLGNVFVGVQPTFGYEGDPMRLLMARGGAPHHGFAAFYTYLEKVFRADAVVHVGTHGALEFMPGKQVGLSAECWPDRLIGELPHLYLYSVNNPSEGTIARRRSYAELLSYLTPPVADAGLYRDLAALKETLLAYRQARDEREREQLYASIEAQAAALHFDMM